MKIEIVQKLCLTERVASGVVVEEIESCQWPAPPIIHCAVRQSYGATLVTVTVTRHICHHTHTHTGDISPFSPSRVPWLISYEL